MSYKIKYKDGTEEKIEAEDWREYGEGSLILFEDKDEKTICAINLDVISKIE